MSKPTITEFLEARVAEDESAAQSATQGHWVLDDEQHPEFIHVIGSGYVIRSGELSAFDEAADAIHIARHDPSRVLAECAAKRAIVRLADDVEGMDYRIQSEWGGYLDGTADDILKALASVYASHPDYQQEWKL